MGKSKTKQTAFLKAMLEEPSITKACEKAGINRSTGYRYLSKPEFKKELDKRQKECINDTVRYFRGKLELCNKTLVDIIEDPKTTAQVKINAINAIYFNFGRMLETSEIIDRLDDIERIIEEGNREY